MICITARAQALILAFAFTAACSETSERAPQKAQTAWAPAPGTPDPASFANRVFYELWIRSFQDSDGDGIGDLKGATERLDELADLGIGAIWLMPTFPSPLADSGYDVADYYAVHPDYGTLSDLEAFVEAAHAKNMLVYLDMVFNHVSDAHPWFQSALTGNTSPYFDWFVWSPAPATRCADVPAGPFGSDRWTKVDAAGMYYFHQFYPRQPDLNFENPAVQEELLNVLRYWMDRGVDGFRFDVPDRYFEEENSCAHNQATIDFHARLRETISGTGTLERGFVGEIWGMHHEIKPFFGPSGNPMIFSFNMMYALYSAALGLGPEPISVLVDEMLRDLPAESKWGIFTGNHDSPRYADVASGDPSRLRLGAALVLTMPGVPYIWMGDELGLHAGSDVNVDWRDGTRTPYPWADEAGFGFTTADEPHLGYAPESGSKSYATQWAQEDSLLRYYRKLIGIRNAEPALQTGAYALFHVDESLWVFDRVAAGQVVRVVHNFALTNAAAWQVDANVTDLASGLRYAPGSTVWVAPGGTAILKRAN